MSITWERITRSPYLYGYVARYGGRTVEVVRAYAQNWRVWRYIDGQQVQGGESQFVHCSTAKRAARIWLQEQA